MTRSSRAKQASGELQRMQQAAENQIGSVCNVWTLGQWYAELFILRDFRVISTNAAVILMSQAVVPFQREVETLGSEKKLVEWYNLLHAVWFSSKVSTEAIKSVTASDYAVVSALRPLQCVKAAVDMGMIYE